MNEVCIEYVGDFPPLYESKNASGADLIANISDASIFEIGDCKLIPTGIKISIPIGYEGQIRPRSGLALKHGITVLNSPGTIDADYRGELKVLLINLGMKHVTIEPGQRIAQLVIAPVSCATFRKVTQLDTTVRNDGEYGSTGIF